MNQLTKNEILSILKKNNIKCNSSLKKDELIKLMKKHNIDKNHKEVKKGSGMWNSISNVARRKRSIPGRFRDLEAIATFIPNKATDRAGGEEFEFSRNLWRNLKRNVLILSCIPTENFEELLQKNKNNALSVSSNEKDDFEQLVNMINKSGSKNKDEAKVKIEPEIFLNEIIVVGGKKNKKKKEKK